MERLKNKPCARPGLSNISNIFLQRAFYWLSDIRKTHMNRSACSEAPDSLLTASVFNKSKSGNMPSSNRLNPASWRTASNLQACNRFVRDPRWAMTWAPAAAAPWSSAGWWARPRCRGVRSPCCCPRTRYTRMFKTPLWTGQVLLVRKNTCSIRWDDWFRRPNFMATSGHWTNTCSCQSGDLL